MGEREWWPPRWAMEARRSLTLPAGSLLMEMFMQGTVVSMAKASGGGRWVVWNHPLEELRACAASSVHRAKGELLSRGFMVELPGSRVAGNGRLFSAWASPLTRPSEYTPISESSTEYTPFSVDTHPSPDSAPGPEYTPISVSSAEYTPISVSTPPEPTIKPRVRARGGVHHHQQHTTTNNEISTPSLTPDPSPKPGRGESSGEPRQDAVPDRWTLALDGLRWAKYRDPEQALARFGVERCLVALSALAGKHEANEYVAKAGGFVFTTLLALEGVEVAPVADVSFARWWRPEVVPGNVVGFRRAK